MRSKHTLDVLKYLFIGQFEITEIVQIKYKYTSNLHRGSYVCLYSKINLKNERVDMADE
jgi:hypothetical protein